MILRGLPPLRTLPKTIEAVCYNRVRLALCRFGRPLRVELGRPALVVVLDDGCWLGLAAWDERFPMLAWTDFETRGRSALHLPVMCRLHLYHIHAGLMMGPAVEALSAQLAERLRPGSPPRPGVCAREGLG